MITLGLDPHPRTHTVAVLDCTGAALGCLTVPNSPEGFEQLHAFAEQFSEHCWAIEGAGNTFIAPFVAQLLANDELVINIPPNLTSQYRSRRGRRKNDEVDAQNAARALLANPTLPSFECDAWQRELQELTRAHRRVSQQLSANKRARTEVAQSASLQVVLDQIVRVMKQQLRVLESQIRALVLRCAPVLLDQVGVGPVVAGLLLSEVGDPRRFPSADHFASFCGAAPVERGSGQNRRMQLNPGGNRRLNWALHIVAVVRLKHDDGRSKALVERLRQQGKGQRASLRILKTYLARELFRVLCQGWTAAAAAVHP